MSAYFTTHHFSPRWTTHRDKGPEQTHDEAAQNPTEGPKSEGAGLDMLARLLHAFQLHYGDQDQASKGSRAHQAKDVHITIHPKFDLVETRDHYTVFGELPGTDRDKVEVEVDDLHCCVTVSGVIERPEPCKAEDEGEGVGQGVGVVHAPEAKAEPKKDEAKTEDAQPSQAKTEAAKPGQAEGSMASKEHETHEENKESEDEAHWHVLERKVGKFHRTFVFPPDLADMSAVHASMAAGLITVVVPKKKGMEGKDSSRRVAVHPGRIYGPFGGLVLSP